MAFRVTCPHLEKLGLLAILTGQAVLLIYSAIQHAPCIDEVGHLAAGVDHWREGRFFLYRVNPPLVRLVATLPLVFMGVKVPNCPVSESPLSRPEFGLGEALHARNLPESLWYCSIARIATIPFATLASVIVFIWSRKLYGKTAAFLSVLIWTFHPFVIGQSELICPDSGGTALGLLSCYILWQWQKAPTLIGTICLGIAIGLAMASRTTLILLYPCFIANYLLLSSCRRHATAGASGGLYLTLAITTSIFVINYIYLFEGTFTPLGKFDFISDLLTSPDKTGARCNLFFESAVGSIPVPLPYNYVLGMDVQRRDFEDRPPFYFAGNWGRDGTIFYYFVGLFFKTPISTLIILIGTTLSFFAGSRVSRMPGTTWRDEIALLLPSAVLFIFISSQTGINGHLRYCLAATPYLAIFCGRFCRFQFKQRFLAEISGLLLSALSLATLLSVYPHQLSYFNCLIGGPVGGSKWFVDSSVDWGQDLFLLKKWLDAHPEIDHIKLAYYGAINPEMVNIKFELPAACSSGVSHEKAPPTFPEPGWYGISVTLLRGGVYNIQGPGRSIYTNSSSDFEYLVNLPVMARLGYSINIYYLNEETCSAIRARNLTP